MQISINLPQKQIAVRCKIILILQEGTLKQRGHIAELRNSGTKY